MALQEVSGGTLSLLGRPRVLPGVTPRAEVGNQGGAALAQVGHRGDRGVGRQDAAAEEGVRQVGDGLPPRDLRDELAAVVRRGVDREGAIPTLGDVTRESILTPFLLDAPYRASNRKVSK